MTDLVKVALIAAIPPTLTSLGTLYATLRVKTKVEVVEKGLNGVQTKLVDATKKAAFAAGEKSEREKQEGR